MSTGDHQHRSGASFSTPELMLLGEIKGLVQGLKDSQVEMHRRMDGMDSRIKDGFVAVDRKMDGMDKRLRAVEQKAAVIGAASGGAMALGTALIVEGIKHWLSRGG
jgi:hypothetical protein